MESSDATPRPADNGGDGPADNGGNGPDNGGNGSDNGGKGPDNGGNGPDNGGNGPDNGGNGPDNGGSSGTGGPTGTGNGPDPVGASDKLVLIIVGSLLAVVALGLVIYFATRTSEEEKALQAVCSARADIERRVENLSQTTVANFTIDSFKNDVEGIRADVRTIRDNEPKLEPNRKQQVQQANAQFSDEVTSTLKTLGRSLSLENAQQKLTDAGQQLVDSYRSSLQPVDCGGVDIGD